MPTKKLVVTGYMIWYDRIMKKILSVLCLSILISVSTISNGVKACDRIDTNTGDCVYDMGNGNLLNAGTGEWIMDGGNGNKIGTDTGELYIDTGNGVLMNTGSGSLLIK